MRKTVGIRTLESKGSKTVHEHGFVNASVRFLSTHWNLTGRSVIAQQYSPASFISLHFHSRMDNWGGAFQKCSHFVLITYFFFSNSITLKLLSSWRGIYKLFFYVAAIICCALCTRDQKILIPSKLNTSVGPAAIFGRLLSNSDPHY